MAMQKGDVNCQTTKFGYVNISIIIIKCLHTHIYINIFETISLLILSSFYYSNWLISMCTEQSSPGYEYLPPLFYLLFISVMVINVMKQLQLNRKLYMSV